jgi:hypothetical protein
VTDSRLAKLSALDVLWSNAPSEEDTSAWVMAVNAAAVREYASGWLEWFMANRSDFEGTDTYEARKEVLANYAIMMGKLTPWFMKALVVVSDYDPFREKPILTLYFAAKVEALASLKVYQDRFLKEKDGIKLEPDIRKYLNHKIANSKEKEPLGVFLFSAYANAYEHTFSFLFKMLSQFQKTYERTLSPEEFDDLTQQLTSKLFKEAFLSRRENVVFETYFGDTDSFFSFSVSEGRFQLGINYPSDEQRSAILLDLESTMAPEERHMQNLRSLPVHYGCPVARGSQGNKTLSSIRFVVQEVISTVREALWPQEDIQPERLLGSEKNYRGLLSKPTL